MSQLQTLQSVTDSPFWTRLTSLSTSRNVDATAVLHLQATVRTVAEHAADISKWICRHLPQYTLHEERHFLNVLSIMGALLPSEVMDRLTPLECALCILASYTHDLGMALSDGEWQEISDETKDTPERRRFAAYRAGFTEHLRHIELWRKKGNSEGNVRIQLIEGYILASFIRDTHTDQQIARINRWLNAIAETVGDQRLYVYGNYDFQHDLTLIDISHGRPARWLRHELTRGDKEDTFYRLVGRSEWANLSFPGVMLRLADIIDFDASRAPRILFRHIGIENDKSILEWSKHLSIVGWDLAIEPSGQSSLMYAAYCEHPVYEKSIRDFGGWIQSELSAAKDELDAQTRTLSHRTDRFTFTLPNKVDISVHAKGWPNHPVYIFRDIQFRLDQSAIMRLFMGESLYGDPSFAIREVLQNSLDALQMRDLRLQMLERAEQPAEPVDRLASGEKLQVFLTWGHDSGAGQDFILIRDSGIGMTEATINEYFAQIGRSFYCCPEFQRECVSLRANDLFPTPISKFGIGILSCFMIADRMEVRTCPGCADGSARRSYDIIISGRDGLFWLKDGTLNRQGTELKLFLKHRYHILYECEAVSEKLREDFGYAVSKARDEGKADRQLLDPVFIVAAHAVWPRYPIVVQPPDGDAIIIDDQFHMRMLVPLRRDDIINRAEKWACPPSRVESLEWACWDWGDTSAENATGSRVRLWFPCHPREAAAGHLPIDPSKQAGLCQQDELAAFVGQCPREGPPKTLLLVNGMHTEAMISVPIGVSDGVGGKAWIDLCGNAAPDLTLSRRRMIYPSDTPRWQMEVGALFQRLSQTIGGQTWATDASIVRNLCTEFKWKDPPRAPSATSRGTAVFDFVGACSPSWEMSSGDWRVLLWPLHRFLQEIRSLHGDSTLARDSHLARIFVQVAFVTGGRTNFRNFLEQRGLLSTGLTEGSRDDWMGGADWFALVISCMGGIDLARDRNMKLGWKQLNDYFFQWTMEIGTVSRTLARIDVAALQCLLSSALQEAFWPDLANSFPMFNLRHLEGKVGDGMLAGPGLVEFKIGSNGRTVEEPDLQDVQPAVLLEYGYDVVFPMTSVSLGNLRRGCPEWRLDRRFRSLGVAPFLLASLDQSWQQDGESICDLFKVSRIFAFLPGMELWTKRFIDWSDDEWQSSGLSALWDIRTGQVLWAKGAHHVDRMHVVGEAIGRGIWHEVVSEGK